jgi:predicted methyltransferase MtxX (methanogen marker protein 4)
VRGIASSAAVVSELSAGGAIEFDMDNVFIDTSGVLPALHRSHAYTLPGLHVEVDSVFIDTSGARASTSRVAPLPSLHTLHAYMLPGLHS